MRDGQRRVGDAPRDSASIINVPSRSLHLEPGGVVALVDDERVDQSPRSTTRRERATCRRRCA
jgi:hypothetical protein